MGRLRPFLRVSRISLVSPRNTLNLYKKAVSGHRNFWSNVSVHDTPTRKGYRDAALAVGGITALASGLACASSVYTSSEEVPEDEAQDEGNDEAEEGFLDYVLPSSTNDEIEETEEESRSSSWRGRGLDVLKSAVSATAVATAMKTWSWPKSLTVDFSWLQERLNALFLELSLGPGSLYSDIVDRPPDPNIYPEVEWDASVRLGEDLCISERAFLEERRRAIKMPFARLVGVNPDEIDERDLPVVAIAGSGGGYRAMLMTAGSLVGAQSSGILPCVTYTAGVSGSCWALSVMYSGVAGSVLPEDVADYLEDRIQVSYLDMSTLDALVTPPTNKYLLASVLRKAAGPTGTVSLVDIYGTLLGSRLFVPSSYETLNPQHLSLHMMRRHIDKGQHPMPIFTAIQHTFPPVAIQAMRELQAEEDSGVEAHSMTVLEEAKKILKEVSSQYLWYEFTPYEVGCDEIGAWIPSWAFGRQFANGQNTERRPELGLPILAGIFGSAFCASLKLYFQEIRPTLDVLPSQLYNWLFEIITDNEEDLGLIHPVMPDQVPNFLRGLDGQLRFGSPPDLTEREYMTFMDAGAELNIPYYPLLRRNVDCIIALDASADSQDLWFTRAEELAAKRGLRTWPKGAGWPVKVMASVGRISATDDSQGDDSLNSDEDVEAQQASRKLAETQETALAEQADRRTDTESRGIPEDIDDESDSHGRDDHDGVLSSLQSCEVWIGSSESSESDSSRLDDLDEDALLKRDGIGIVYIPLAANDDEVPGFDPFSVSTWRRELTAEESQALLDVSEANFENSRVKIVRLLRAIWLRKKRDRERREFEAHFISHFHRNLPREFS